MPLPARTRRNSDRAARARECPSHRAWVRGFPCVNCDQPAGDASNPIEAAHLRLGTGGGTSLKPSDRWVLALCTKRHIRQHGGERTFWANSKVRDPHALAAEFARKSPHRAKLEGML